MNRIMRIINCWIVLVFLGNASLRAGTIASWNFEDIPPGSEYGTTTIIATTSSVNHVVAEGFANDPLYIRGADGVGHGMASGYLRVLGSAATESLFSGFTALNFSFDARLASAPAATQIIFNYGVTTQSWSVYVTSDSVLHFKIYDSTGASVDLNTYTAGMPADSSYHHYEIAWDGSSAQILRDGTAQLLENGTSDSWPVTLSSAVRSAGGDGQIGIGGMIRDNLTYAYEFGGFLDNIVISTPKKASLTLITFSTK